MLWLFIIVAAPSVRLLHFFFEATRDERRGLSATGHNAAPLGLGFAHFFSMLWDRVPPKLDHGIDSNARYIDILDTCMSRGIFVALYAMLLIQLPLWASSSH